MRPASEIHTALEMLEGELPRQTDAAAINNLSIARDVLAWVAGGHWTDLTDGPNPWLSAFLLDDPPKIDPTLPGDN